MGTEITTQPLSTVCENTKGCREGVESSTLPPAALQLLSEAGHDLRSPLAGIRSAIQVLADEHLGPLNLSQSELITDTLAQCDSLLDLSENMLSIARLQRKNPGIVYSWIDPFELYKSLRAGLETAARVRQIQICWDGFTAFQRPIFGDKIALQRLIYNLVGNAIQASREKAEVHVSIKMGEDPQLAEITISDSGYGIRPEDLSKISNHGFSGQNRSGLGLAICQVLASWQLTRLQVQNSPGGGSQFSFEVAFGHIRSVARLYLKWRNTLCVIKGDNQPNDRPKGTLSPNAPLPPSINMVNGNHKSGVRNLTAAKTLRIDPASAPATNQRTEPSTPTWPRLLAVHNDQPEHPNTIVATQLHLPAMNEASGAVRLQSAEEMNRFIQSRQHPHELAYHYDDTHWFMFWDCNSQASCQQRQQQLASDFESRFAVRPTFEKPIVISIDPKIRDTKSTQNVVHDLMLRSTLLGRLPRSFHRFDAPLGHRKTKLRRNPCNEVHSIQTPELPAPDQCQPSTWNRIDQEIRQLRLQLSNQARRLSDHADHLSR